MPPQYAWICENCQKQAETYVPMEQSSTPPEECKDDQCEYHIWKRDYTGKAPTKVYGSGWGYRKGQGYDW